MRYRIPIGTLVRRVKSLGVWEPVFRTTKPVVYDATDIIDTDVNVDGTQFYIIRLPAEAAPYTHLKVAFQYIELLDDTNATELGESYVNIREKK